MINKITYRLHRYFFSSKPVVPMIIIFTFIAYIYSVKPMDVNSGFIISGVFQFLLVTFVVQNINGNEISDEEQILFLRERKGLYYFIFREISMITIVLIFSVIITLGPVYINCLNNFELFIRCLTIYDVLMGFLLILGSGFVGIVVGDIFNPRIMIDRKQSKGLTILIVVLTIAKDSIQKEYDSLLFLDYILPPVMKPAKVFAKCEVFMVTDVVGIFALMCIYYFIVTWLKIMIMNRRRFM